MLKKNLSNYIVMKKSLFAALPPSFFLKKDVNYTCMASKIVIIALFKQNGFAGLQIFI